MAYAAIMFSSQVALLTAGFLIVIGAAGVGFFWIRGRRGRGDLLPDTRVSTWYFLPSRSSSHQCSHANEGLTPREADVRRH